MNIKISLNLRANPNTKKSCERKVFVHRPAHTHHTQHIQHIHAK